MSVKKLLPYLLEFVHPQSVVEVGCGEGALLEGFQQNGVRIQGIDSEEYAQASFWQENKDFFMSANLEKVRISCQSKFDLAVCLECAHKFTEERAKNLIHDVCLLSDVVLFSAGIPGQDDDTVNGQMTSYWENLFKQNDFMMLDCIRPEIWECEEIKASYRQNTLLYVREEVLAKYPSLMKFYILNGNNLLRDVVHSYYWKRIMKKMEMLPMSVKKKSKVIIVCKENVWEDIFKFIDTDEIEICACFGDLEQVPEIIMEELKDRFYSFNDLFVMIESLQADYYIMKCNYDDMMDVYYPKMNSLGIGNERIINLEIYFGLSRYIGIMYYYQWKYLLENKPEFDYIITGGSISKMGFDLDAMMPYEGIKLSTNSQSIYYQYKIAEAYFAKCLSSKKKPKFVLIDISIIALLTKLYDDPFYYNDLFYFPIIGHDKAEYVNRHREGIYRRLFTSKSIKWLEEQIQKIKKFSANDRDGQIVSMEFTDKKLLDEKFKQQQIDYTFHRLSVNQTVIDYNMNMLERYVCLCEKYHTVPFIVRFPHSEQFENQCPIEYKKIYSEMLKYFGERVRFIDLWGQHFPDDYTSDFFHLNTKGAKVATEIIKNRINGMGL